jgi:PST family polysaccharide transporter
VLGGLRVIVALVVDLLMALDRPRASLRGNAAWLAAAVPAVLIGAELGGIRGVAVGHVAAALAVAIPLFTWEARRAGVRLALFEHRPVRQFSGLLAGGLAGVLVVAAVAPDPLALTLGGLVTMAAYLPIALGASRARALLDLVRGRSTPAPAALADVATG